MHKRAGKMGVFLLWVFCAAGCLLVPLRARAEAPSPPSATPPPSAEAVMDAIHALMDESAQSGDREASWNRVLALREQLGRCGAEAVPAITARIDGEKDAQTRQVLVAALGMIPGEEVDRFLLRLCCGDSTVGLAAGDQLVMRTERFGPFAFRVPEDQMEALLAMVRDRPVMGVGDPMRILACCHGNDLEPVVRAMLKRFLLEVKAPDDQPPVGGSYTSPRVYMLNKFLLAFRHMPERAVPVLREAHTAAERAGDLEAAKWVAMARGFCRDRAVADALREVVLHDPDRYVRCQAIPAYGWTAGVDAVAVLRPLLEDTTETEYHADFPPTRFIIRNTARDTLMRVLREELGEGAVNNENFEEVLDTVGRR